MKICSVEGCGKKVKAHGFCSKHYLEAWKIGKDLGIIPDRPKNNKICKVNDYYEIFFYDRSGQESVRIKISPKDADVASAYRWHVRGGYACTTVNGSNMFLHNIIMGSTSGTVDHINRDRLDNRRENLRFASNFQNAANKAIRKDNSTGFKGVWYVKKNKKYRASIQSENKRIYLGLFNTPEEAANAYNSAAKNLHKDFAFVNKFK